MKRIIFYPDQDPEETVKKIVDGLPEGIKNKISPSLRSYEKDPARNEDTTSLKDQEMRIRKPGMVTTKQQH